MKAVSVQARNRNFACLELFPEPDIQNRPGLVGAIAVVAGGADAWIAEGKSGWAPPNTQRLIQGHESFGRVMDPGPITGLRPGDLGVGVARRPDSVSCPIRAVGEWDTCRNGHHTDHGIRQIDGYMSRRWRIEPEYAVKGDAPLDLRGVVPEPTTVVAKAWERAMAMGKHSFGEPRNILITGARPIGLLGAFLGLRRGLEVHVFDRITSGIEPEPVKAVGATYLSGSARAVGFRTGHHHRTHRRRAGPRRLHPATLLGRHPQDAQ